jgi:hypothetical protein
MNHYRTSNGERISKQQIDSKVSEEYSYNFCEKCGRSSGVYLDCSHVLSVKYCQENGMSEKAFDKDNIKILCREHHQALDGLDLRFKK